MPGSMPATSQLDWLSSMTAMIVLFWSRATRDLLKSFGWGIAGTPSIKCSDEVAIPRRPPHSVSPLEGRRFELVWGFSCQVVFWFVGGSLFGAGKPFFVPSPAIRFAERAERGQGIETVAKLGGLPPSDACVSQRLRPEHASDDELRRGFLHSFGIWAVPPLMIRGELAIGCSFVPQTCMR